MEPLSLAASAAAGAASFFSPCCLPLYPTYLAYLAGTTGKNADGSRSERGRRLRLLLHSASFLAGLSVVFFALSWSAGALAGLFAEHRTAIRIAGALLLLVMGAFLLGFLRPKPLLREWRWLRPLRNAGFFGSFAAGIGFAAGWSPCIGSTLSLIVALSAAQPDRWLLLTTAYAAGFAVPFLLLGGFVGASRRLLPYTGAIQKAGGALLIGMAALLLTDRLSLLSDWVSRSGLGGS